ncbi:MULTISPECIES: dipeptide/tripeptide permease DtpA [Enterobacteriaceae]|uniref:Dipeptide and tripeptide permease A n=2 Tax=Enterobacteriaceae TaxID=543 RepID=A0ABW1Q0Y8_9ENTR|nr:MULTISPECIES: dipeptide/tripeptide permease DtpA [Phytobacter]AUU91390.1 dipeptide/tripeptide permease DtpA [Enterobacteriaceae bacterium ENNIH3]AUV08593.1 dipeptide/tripeptide permease DtpA [Enterobacteriaceae bacterium ENNIH2]MBS6736771.1 dipeptide/tripeptide permease DtpA [Enterobacteriaceae bacterium]PTA96089.1 dipeptide/tripeptide permease DtpA [Kluyvera sp. Nf5]PWF50175.1 dipeptide/tripeptide permease DtpA [[Kluyvera] intestini]PXW56775.1 POT family proton-dependent oligopeptide tran
MSTANKPTESVSLNAFKQPKAFYLIFSIELWERFGFYGLQGIMAVYLVKQLGMSEADSITLFSSFSALVYGLVAIGGWLGDKVLGTKRVIMLGAIVLAIGYALVAWSGHDASIVYMGMAAIAVGNGLFKANPSSLLSTCYAKDDPRLDGAFTMYYMAVNVGSFFSMLATPWLAAEFGWSTAFALSVVGLLITIVNFAFCKRWVKNYGSKPDFEPVRMGYLLATIVGVAILITIATWLLHNQGIARMVLGVVALCIVCLFAKETFALQGAARRKMIVAFILMLQAIVFFVLYSQMPTSLNFFAIRNVEHTLLGITFEPEQFQALNPFWIIIGSPILAAIYNKMGDTLPMPYKFAIGMVLCSGAFLILPLGAKFASDAGIVSVNWLVASYGLQSIGELMISGLGLAMVAQLVPQRLMGFIMGSWFLTTAGANIIAGYVANQMAIPENVTDPLMSLDVYGHVFLQIGIVTAVIAALMILAAPKLNRMTQSDDSDKAAKASETATA